MLISQIFNHKTGDLENFIEHCKRVETTNNIAMDNFPASDKDSDTMKNIKRSKKTNEREDSGKKRRKNTSLYCSLHGDKTSHTSRECKVIKTRDGEKDKSKYVKRY